MKKKLICFSVFYCLISPKVFSQDFLGISTGNYSGITGVMLQPASIVDSRFKFDINLFSTGVNYSNNYFLLNRDVILKFNKNKFENYETFKDRYLSEASLPAGEKAFFNIDNRTQLPLSFMATTGKKSALALNMQFRTKIQGRGITQELANQAYNNFNPILPITSIDASGVNINSLSWAEAGITYGRVVLSSGKHYLKMAVTGKYLAGLSSISMSADNLQLRVNSDSSFDFNSPLVNYNHSADADFKKLFDRDISNSATAFGFDAGLVYEFRGNLDKFKYIKKNDEKSYDAIRRDVSKYIFKVGVSLVDVGMFNFEKPANVNSFAANINNWNIKNGNYKSLKEFDTALAARVVSNIGGPRDYNVYLPTALSGQLDIKFAKGLFLNAMGYWPLKLGSLEGNRFNNYGYYTVTPRYETRHFGIYIPYTVSQKNEFTDYKQHLIGLTLRAGPLFIGSSNLGSMLLKENLKAADVHLGLKIGVTYGKPNKSNKFLEKIFVQSDELKIKQAEADEAEETKMVKKEDSPKKKTDEKVADNRGLILDYKTQKVYDNPDVKQNLIIINNNYYYGNTQPQSKSDTIVYQADYLKYNADSLRAVALERTRLENKKKADSIYQVTKDSLDKKRTQLDSLIRSMQRLKIDMDSQSIKMDSITNERSYNNPGQINKVGTKNDMVIKRQDSIQKTRLMVNNQDSVNDDNAAFARSVEELNASIDSSGDKNDAAQKAKVKSRRFDSTQNKATVAKTKVAEDFKTAEVKKKDSLVIIPKEIKSKKETEKISSKEENLRAAPKQEELAERNTENLQERQQQQNELYQKYAEESRRLSKDIDLLNKRIVVTEQNRQPNVSYVPVSVPYNDGRNYDREVRTVYAPAIKPDTVYIRDTIKIYSTDVVQNNTIDTVQQIIKIRETKTDTVKVTEPAKKLDFNYADIPEEHILFGIGKSEIQSIYEGRLNFKADILRKNPDVQVLITGHTDATGSKAINEKLSMQRAEAVSFYLMKKGVSAKQILVNSLASDDPAVAGSTQTARSQNRRVVLKLKQMEK